MVEKREGSGGGELVAEAAMEGIEEDFLDGEGIAMLGVEFATALSVADMDPVGGPIGSAGKTIFLDESLEENRAVAVARLPMGREAFGDTSEDARGKVVRSDPREDEEASIVGDEMEKTFALLVGPTDELVTRSDFPGSGSEAEGSKEVGATQVVDTV